MSRSVLFVALLVAFLGGIAAFNLIIGVFGLSWAIFTLIAFIFFAIYISFRKQPEEKDPHA